MRHTIPAKNIFSCDICTKQQEITNSFYPQFDKLIMTRGEKDPLKFDDDGEKDNRIYCVNKVDLELCERCWAKMNNFIHAKIIEIRNQNKGAKP